MRIVRMSRFADFTLLEDLGRNTVARCYRAVSERSDEPVFLQCFDALTHALCAWCCCDAIGSARADLRQHLLLPVERGKQKASTTSRGRGLWGMTSQNWQLLCVNAALS